MDQYHNQYRMTLGWRIFLFVACLGFSGLSFYFTFLSVTANINMHLKFIFVLLTIIFGLGLIYLG